MEDIIKRDECVLCCNKKLINFTNITSYKKMYIDIVDKNNYWNMQYGYCENCFSVQLMTLLNPDILYGDVYFQPLNTTYIWVQHNISFVQFIVDNININKPMIEIGSSSFCLGKHLTHYYKDYTVFDYSLKSCIKQENVKYIEGNCENYNFPEESVIIMSHVFEHLYEPKIFIKNCKDNGVKDIIMSIPEMFITNHNVSDQHTFSYNKNDIEYIFSLFNYKLNKFINFNTNDNLFHCLFFHFTLRDEVKVERSVIKNRHLHSKEMLKKNIFLKRKSFICPSGMYANIVYNKIINPEEIICFIDIDPLKHDKIFGNTNLQIKHYSILSEYDDADIYIYTNINKNIINTIRKYNQKINIIEL